MSVTMQGTGIPAYIRPLEMRLAPIDENPETFKTDATPGGLLLSFPPTMHLYPDVECTVQRMVPIAGFKLDPKASARFLVLFRASARGQVRVGSDRVVYTQGGKTFYQVLQYGLKLAVKPGAPALEPTDGEKACARLGNLLPAPAKS
jgi:hypothetical protein